jgi:molecular chaperone DnaK
MNRTTIDFGIDLGTTNSAIAVLKGVTTEIIKNNSDADVTPSAVSIDKKGAVFVGQRAKNYIYDRLDDTCIEFKRQMGTDHLYQFKSSGQRRKPEELSSEILKSLRADVQQRTGEIVEACVVTVPAAFELNQCDSTRKAAKLAGFKESPLLQEPVAAALAYGFQADQEKAYWLVYDFGGGTFDAAVIKAEEGTVHVVNHGGDNFLGGSDIDWALVEQILVPRLLHEFNLKDFARSNQQWRPVFAKLKHFAEIAKVELSRSERTTLQTCRFRDGSGKEIEFECEMSRGELVKVAEPIIVRSVDICKRVLKEKKLSRDAVEKVILVGGPTLAPYFRELLENNLSIRLDHTVDPLTVVARGAAIFSGTQRFEAHSGAPVAAGEYSIDLKHKPVGMDSAPMVGGRVSSQSVADLAGYTLELVNTKTQWRSGKIPLRADGVFLVNLHAERGDRNTFAIELFDPSGRLQKTTPDILTYTVGAVVEEQPLINSMGISLATNEYDKLVEKGRGLPVKATRDYRTTSALSQGQSGEVLKIPVIEGEFDRADRNRLVGSLEIKAEEIRRDLPAGSDVEVTLRIDESRIITVNAYVPLLDEDFAVELNMKHNPPEPERLKQEYEAEMKRLRELKAKAGDNAGGSVEESIQEIENSPLIQEVKGTVAAAQGDPDAAMKCEKRLLELKLRLDEAEDTLEWPALLAEVRMWLKDLDTVVSQHGSQAQRDRASQIVDEVDDFIAKRQMDSLRKKLSHVRQLYFEIVFAQPGFWVQQFRWLENEKHKMSDQARALRLLDQGRECIGKNNVTGLQNIVRQLWDLLPSEAVKDAQRGFQSGVVR